MSTSKSVDQARHGSDSSIRSTKNIIKNDNLLKSSSQNTLNIASEKKTIEQLLTTCKPNVQYNKKDTENCLKRFEQKYNELMKQKNEIKFTKYSKEKEDVEMLLPNTEQIKLINHNECSSIEECEVLSLNLSNINLNKREEPVKPNNNNYTYGSNDMQNINIKNLNYKDLLKKCYDYNNVDTYYDSSYKYENRNNDEIKECFNDIKMQQKQVLLSNNKFHEILDVLNNEIIKMKEQLTENKEFDSLSNSDNCIIESNEIFTEEGCVDVDASTKDPHYSLVNQMVAKSNNNHEYRKQSQLNPCVLSNEYTQYSNTRNHQNLQYVDEQMMNEQKTKNLPEQKKPEEFYQIQSLNHKTEDLIRIIHFFSEHNPNVCQCGIINNI